MPNDIHSRTEQRARHIWEREGRPEGRSAEHWRLAEEEIAREDVAAADEAAAKEAAERTVARKPSDPPTSAVTEKRPAGKGRAAPKKK